MWKFLPAELNILTLFQTTCLPHLHWTCCVRSMKVSKPFKWIVQTTKRFTGVTLVSVPLVTACVHPPPFFRYESHTLFVKIFARTNFRTPSTKHQNSVLIFAQFRANILLKQHFYIILFQNMKFKNFRVDKFSRTCKKL